MPSAQIGIAPQHFVLLVLRWSVTIAPKQNLASKIHQFRPCYQIRRIAGARDHKVKTISSVIYRRLDLFVTLYRIGPWGGEVQVEIREFYRSFDRVGRGG